MSAIPPGGRVVVTGVTGFVGTTLARVLIEAGFRVSGVANAGSLSPWLSTHIDEFVVADLTSGWPSLAPYDGIVHLAGLAAVGPSFEEPQRYIGSNSAMVTHLCEHLVATNLGQRLLLVSSGAVYDSSGDHGPLTEDDALDFSSPYVVSKVLNEHQAAYYRRRGLDVVVARPFNHIGPGQGPGFIVPDLVEKVRRLGDGAVLETGNLEAGRDYTDVRDVAAAYLALLRLPSPRHATYNVASGTAHTGRTVLEAVCAALGVPLPPTRTRATRAIDPGHACGSATRLREETGWRPTYDLRTSISDFVAST